MTVFFDSEIDRLLRRMTGSFFGPDDASVVPEGAAPGSYYYGYTMTVGPDGKPIVKEYGNVRPGLRHDSETREPIVDTILDEKDGVVKLIAEMPGVEKADVKILVDGKVVDISAGHDGKKYHARVPLRHKVHEDSARATYKNGILQVVFKLAEEKPAGKRVEVE